MYYDKNQPTVVDKLWISYVKNQKEYRPSLYDSLFCYKKARRQQASLMHTGHNLLHDAYLKFTGLIRSEIIFMIN